jgi:hypothetical protein
VKGEPVRDDDGTERERKVTMFRILAERLGWPDGTVGSCLALEDAFPEREIKYIVPEGDLAGQKVSYEVPGWSFTYTTGGLALYPNPGFLGYPARKIYGVDHGTLFATSQDELAEKVRRAEDEAMAILDRMTRDGIRRLMEVRADE